MKHKGKALFSGNGQPQGCRRLGRRVLSGVSLAVLGVGLLIGGCSRDVKGDDALLEAGVEVKTRLGGVYLEDAVAVHPEAVSSQAALRSESPLVRSAYGNDTLSSDLFSVTLAEAEKKQSTEESDPRSSVSTGRAASELNNVWVFQFGPEGYTVRCEYIDVLSPGSQLEVILFSGRNYTIGVLANGPESGLSAVTVPDLTTFREKLLYTQTVSAPQQIPYGGVLENISVLTDGRVQVGDSASQTPVITLRRILAEVTVSLEYLVEGYTLDGVELYNVPKGAAYGVDPDATEFPEASAGNFAYHDEGQAGLAPHRQEGNNYTWYIGDNLRGTSSGIATPQDKNKTKAPGAPDTYATYARVKTHFVTDPEAVLYYDIFLGADMRTDFNVASNHVYTYNTRISGTAKDQYDLIGVDGRVSGTSPMQISGATVSPAVSSIPREGGEYTVTLSGKMVDPVSVRAVLSAVEGEEQKIVTASAPSTTKQAVLEIPENAHYATRTVRFEYEATKDNWVEVTSGSGTQAAYNVSVETTIPETIPQAGGTYNVTLKGDFPVPVAVQARIDGVGDPITASVSQVGGTVQLTIPANETYDADRNVTFEYQWNGEQQNIKTVKQSGYAVTNASVSGSTSVPQSGAAEGTYKVTLTGSLPATVDIRAIITGTETVLATGQVSKSGTAANLSAIAANTTYASRSITFQYQWNGTWTAISGSYTQAGYTMTSVAHTASSGTIVADGGSVTITLTGTMPASVPVQMIISGGSTTQKNATGSGTTRTVNFDVPANTGGTRTITFQYQWNGVWRNIDPTITQAASILGLDYTDNAKPWFDVYETDNSTDTESSTWMTGGSGTDGSKCPAGWRMPTHEELMLMYVYNDRLGLSDDSYWGHSGSSNFGINFATGGSDITSGSKRVRCVRSF